MTTQTVAEQLGKNHLEAFRAHPALVSPDAIGVELELEGWTSSSLGEAQRALHPLWQTTSDGSLRNGGAEFITNGGLGGQDLHQAFERMVALLERVNYDASWRCSTHMHLNMLDFTVNQVARFLMVYAACEPVFFKHCGQFRRSSNFCTPVGDSLPFHKKLISRLWDDVVATRGASQSTNKYTALNLQPLFGNDRQRALGTVEFRGGRPMTQLSEFVLQANLLLSIKQFVRTFEGNEEQMLTRLNDGVFNTVYANGCASELEVSSQELDDALIHSWLLLKAYQIGMTKKKASREEMTFGGFAPTSTSAWGPSQIVTPQREPNRDAIGRTLDVFGHFNPMIGSVSDEVRISREVAPKLHRYMAQLIDRELPEESRSQYITVALMDTGLGDSKSTGDDASKFSLLWNLALADNYLKPIEQRVTSPVAAIQRQIEARSMGVRPTVVPTVPPSRQPYVNFHMGIKVNYKAAFRSRVIWDAFIERFGFRPERHGNTDLFNWLLTTNVRVLRRPCREVNAVLTTLGASTGLVEGVNQAVYVKYCLRMADKASDYVIHPSDLGLYDWVCYMVDMLQGQGCTVPVYKKDHISPQAPNGILRLELSPTSGCGIGVPPRVCAERVRTTPVRLSPTTNENIY